MDTIKTCNLDNDKKHVCFKDLKDFWRKDEYFDGLNELEKERIRLNLNLPAERPVDTDLSKISKNPVQNRIVTLALERKVDVNALSKVGITGQYKDLKEAPCELPNPEGILFNLGPDSQVYYDGTEGVVLNLKTKLSLFENDKNFATKKDIEDAISIRGVKVNGVIQTDCEKYVDIFIPTEIGQLYDNIGIVLKKEYENKIKDLERRISNLESKFPTPTP